MGEPHIEIVNTTADHVRAMGDVMRQSSKDTAIKAGISPRRAMWRSYKNSLWCKTAFIEERIAAIWGISGGCFSETGLPWLIMSPDVEEYPMRVAFRFKQELKEMQATFPLLEDYVDAEDVKAIRLLSLMGFKINKNLISYNGMKMVKAERRAS